MAINRNTVFFIFSLLVTIGVFTFLFRYVSLREVFELIRGMDRNAVLMFFVLSLTMSFFRLWRYMILLRVSGYQPNSKILFLIVVVRNFFSDLLPARIGTAIYIYLVNSRLRIPLSVATSSFALAFLFDLIAIAPLILLGLFAFGVPDLIPTFPLAIASILFFLLCLVILWVLPSLCSVGQYFFESLKFLKSSTREALANFLDSIREELIKTKNAGVYWRVLTLSFFVRISKYAAMYVILYGLLNPIGYDWPDLPVGPVFLGMCAAEFSASLPISGIAGFGLYEGTWHLVFTMLGFPERIAAMTAISHHLFTQVYGYAFGVVCLIIITLPIWRSYSTPHNKAEEASVYFYSKVLASIIFIFFCLWLVSLPNLGSANTQTENRTVEFSPPEEDKLKELADLTTALPGEIVFDSNREGTFGIYAITTDGRSLRTIFQTEHHEMYPDVSPDGQWITFSQALSTSRIAPSDIWIIRRDGSDARLVAEDGVFPTFSADGKTIYFERQRKRVMALSLETEDIKELFPAGQRPFTRHQVVKPRVSPDGLKVAFTSDRRGNWNAWYAELLTGEAHHIANGCEPTWSHEGNNLIFVKTSSARAGSGLYSHTTSQSGIDIFHDRDDPFGHEYFPTLIEQDSYTLFSASPGDQHSHLEANYQLFIRDNAQDRIYRLNFDDYTNRWPKYLPAKQ